MNNKGFTVVELIITFVIVMTIALGLFSTVDSYRERQQQEMYKKELESYKNEILKIIQDDITSLGLDKLNKLDIFTYEVSGVKICKSYDQGLELEFRDGTKKVLCFGNNVIDGKATLLYDNQKFVSPSKFVKFEQDIIDSENAEAYSFIRITEVVEDDPDNPEYKSSILSKKVYSVNIKLLHSELKDKTYLNIVAPTITSTVSSMCSVEVDASGNLTLTAQKYNICGSEIFAEFGDRITTLKITGSSSDSIKHVLYLNKIDVIKVSGKLGISDNAFKNEEGLNTIDLSELSNTSDVGRNVFEDTNIKTLIIKDNKKTAFESMLNNVGTVETLKIIKNGDSALSEISPSLKGKIKKLFIPDDFTSVEEFAFFGVGLEEVYFSKNISEIKKFAFAGNNIYSSLGGSADFTSMSNLKIEQSAFEGNNISYVYGNENFKYIGDYAFYNNPISGELNLDAEYIGRYSFRYDKGTCPTNVINKLVFGSNVRTLGKYAFNCIKLTEQYTTVKILNTIETVGIDAVVVKEGCVLNGGRCLCIGLFACSR